MKKLLLLLLFIMIVPFVFGSEPYILPTIPYTYDNLLGICNDTADLGTILTYQYEWFNNSNSYLNGVIDPFCYQETANISSVCGGLNTGKYYYDGIGTLFINYSKPANALNSSLWQAKYGITENYPTSATIQRNTTANFTISSSCWSETVLQFKLNSHSDFEANSGNITFECFNGSSWEVMFFNESYGNSVNCGGNEEYWYDGNWESGCTYAVGHDNYCEEDATVFFEEGMFWNMNYNNHSLLYDNTTIYDEWIFSCRAYDGENYSSWLNSSSVTIINDIPTVPSFNISSPPYYYNDTINISPYNSTNIDGHTISYYCEIYNINDTSIQAYSTNCTYYVNSSDIRDDLRIRVKAYDGYNYSVVAEENISILNSVPSVTSITIAPAPANETQDLNFTYTCSDNDPADTCNASAEFDWFIDGNSSGYNTTHLATGNTSAGANIIASARVFDGYNWSSWYNSTTFQVSDTTSPVITGVLPIPDTLTTADTTALTANCSDIGISEAIAEIEVPGGSLLNRTMTLVSGDQYAYTYAPPAAGTYFFRAFCIDGSGNTAVSLQEAFSVTAYVPLPTGGGGGGGDTTISFDFDGISVADKTTIYISDGQTKEQELKLTNEGPVEIAVSVYIDTAQTDALAKDWLTFGGASSVTDLVISNAGGLNSNTRYLRYSVFVPKNTPFGAYDVVLRLTDGDSVALHTIEIVVGDSFLAPIIDFLDNELFELEGGCINSFDAVEVCEETEGITLRVWHVVLVLFIIVGGLFLFRKKRKSI